MSHWRRHHQPGWQGQRESKWKKALDPQTSTSRKRAAKNYSTANTYYLSFKKKKKWYVGWRQEPWKIISITWFVIKNSNLCFGIGVDQEPCTHSIFPLFQWLSIVVMLGPSHNGRLAVGSGSNLSLQFTGVKIKKNDIKGATCILQGLYPRSLSMLWPYVQANMLDLGLIMSVLGNSGRSFV